MIPEPSQPCLNVLDAGVVAPFPLCREQKKPLNSIRTTQGSAEIGKVLVKRCFALVKVRLAGRNPSCSTGVLVLNINIWELVFGARGQALAHDPLQVHAD